MALLRDSSYSDSTFRNTKHFKQLMSSNVMGFALFKREIPHLSTAMAAIEYIDENMAVIGKKF